MPVSFKFRNRFLFVIAKLYKDASHESIKWFEVLLDPTTQESTQGKKENLATTHTI
jgi:hypothetical protein